MSRLEEPDRLSQALPGDEAADLSMEPVCRAAAQAPLRRRFTAGQKRQAPLRLMSSSATAQRRFLAQRPA